MVVGEPRSRNNRRSQWNIELFRRCVTTLKDCPILRWRCRDFAGGQLIVDLPFPRVHIGDTQSARFSLSRPDRVTKHFHHFIATMVCLIFCDGTSHALAHPEDAETVEIVRYPAQL